MSKARLIQAITDVRKKMPDARFRIETREKRYPKQGIDVVLFSGHSWFQPVLYSPRLTPGFTQKASSEAAKYSTWLAEILEASHG